MDYRLVRATRASHRQSRAGTSVECRARCCTGRVARAYFSPLRQQQPLTCQADADYHRTRDAFAFTEDEFHFSTIMKFLATPFIKCRRNAIALNAIDAAQGDRGLDARIACLPRMMAARAACRGRNFRASGWPAGHDAMPGFDGNDAYYLFLAPYIITSSIS